MNQPKKEVVVVTKPVEAKPQSAVKKAAAQIKKRFGK